MANDEYVFEESETKKESAAKGFCSFIWNSETNEFCGRDGASWGKLSLFYSIFYFFLGSFFIGMLALFMQMMPKDRPTYYGETSVMNSRVATLNPGLGFRPQTDVEDHVIKFNPLQADSAAVGYGKYVKNLEHFLAAKYKCEDKCDFDYVKIFEGTNCTAAKDFGYTTHMPCVLVKLNRIISWVPELASGATNIEIKCNGEGSADKDNLKRVIYHSEGSPSGDVGLLNTRHFPYDVQQGYSSPFVFVQFDVMPNTLVNIECKAYALNIDNTDRMNRRGMTRLSLYITNKNK